MAKVNDNEEIKRAKRMSKAVLVTTMPKNCYCCQLGEVVEWGVMMCSWEHRSLPMRGGRPDWCPLIPEPKRFITTQSVIKDHDVDVVSWYMGWNACLDALEGKT